MHDSHNWFDSLLPFVLWPPALTLVGARLPTAYVGYPQSSSKGSSLQSVFSEKLQRAVHHDREEVLTFAKRLDTIPAVRLFQETPLALSYRPDAQSRVRKFRPDLLLILEDGRCIFVEVRSPAEMSARANWYKWRALRSYCRERGFGLLITDGNSCIQHVSRTPVRGRIRHGLLALVQQGPIDAEGYIRWAKASHISERELLAVIISERLAFQPFPFLLAHPDQVSATWPENVTVPTGPRKGDKRLSELWEADGEFFNDQGGKTIEELDEWSDNSFDLEGEEERVAEEDDGWYYPDPKPIQTRGKSASSPSRPVEDEAFKLLTLRRRKSE